MNKLTAIIDKSLLQRICGEQPLQREVLMNLLRQKYQLIVAFPLVDEVLANVAKCPKGKDPVVIAETKRQMDALYPCFMNEVSEMVFEELVLNKPLHTIPWLSAEFVRNYGSLSTDPPEFLEAMADRQQGREEIEQSWKQQQNDSIPPGKFFAAKSEQHFFTMVAKDLRFMLHDSEWKLPLLERLLGDVFRRRHAEEQSRIQAAFAQLSDENVDCYPFTREFLLVQLMYRYAPVSKVLDQDFPPPILDRQDQRNNLEDMQYVASAAMCERLITGDEKMAKIMRVLSENRWTGETIWIDPKKDLPSQILSLLV